MQTVISLRMMIEYVQSKICLLTSLNVDLIFAAPPHQELGAKRHFLFFLSPHYLRYAHCTEMDVLFFKLMLIFTLM